MASTINLSLTDELRAFIDENCGDHSLYATPSEFLRSLLREKKEKQEITDLRNSILEGFDDALYKRTIKFDGSLDSTLKKAKKSGW